jgi:hypothetical protein
MRLLVDVPSNTHGTSTGTSQVDERFYQRREAWWRNLADPQGWKARNRCMDATTQLLSVSDLDSSIHPDGQGCWFQIQHTRCICVRIKPCASGIRRSRPPSPTAQSASGARRRSRSAKKCPWLHHGQEHEQNGYAARWCSDRGDYLTKFAMIRCYYSCEAGVAFVSFSPVHGLHLETRQSVLFSEWSRTSPPRVRIQDHGHLHGRCRRPDTAMVLD